MSKNPKPQSLEQIHNSRVDLKERIVYLVTDIDTATVYPIILAIRELAKTDGEIVVHLSSTGGDPYAAMAVYDTLREVPNEITIVGYGQIMSAAAILLQAGDTRLLSARSRFMVHNGTWQVGDAHSSVAVAVGKEADALNLIFYKLFAQRSNGKLSIEDAENFCLKESYLSAREAVKYGFADGTIGDAGKITWAAQ